MNLVLQSFGRESEYKRALLTILSFYAHTDEHKGNRILLFTDHPSYFEDYLQGLPVEYVLLTADKIKKMRGAIDFLHRMKIALIEEAFSLTEGNLLYADSDTFFIDDPQPWVERVSEVQSFMHLHEYQFEELRNIELPAGKPFHDFLHLIEAKNFVLSNESEIKLFSKDSSWNAGVMILHSSHKRFIPDVYALTEQFYPSTHNHASEQYAFSIILQKNTKLDACEPMIYHYWYRVKKQIVDGVLSKKINSDWAGLTMEEKLKEVKQWTKELPFSLEKHVLSLKDNSVQELNKNNFRQGYYWALKALRKGALGDIQFIKDVLYHAKRQVTGK